jgi:Uma2 family endonuclease
MSNLTASPLVKTYNLEEFWQLPNPEDGTKLELIAGVLYMTPPPDYKHDNIAQRLISLLSRYIFDNKIKGRLYVPRAAIWTGPNTFLEPDLFFMSAELELRINPEHRETADLVIEIISPNSAIYDRNAKADTYAALDVKEIWLIDEIDESVEVRNNIGKAFSQGIYFRNKDYIRSSVFPNLNFDVKNIFID